MTITNLSEWFNISILKNTEGYPFGLEGPKPYFYKTAKMYSAVNLAWGLIFLTMLISVIWFLIKGKINKVYITFGFTILVFIIMLIHNNIGT